MLDLYQKQTKCLVALDSIIFGFDGEKLKLLLIKRGIEANESTWSLMGGWLQENESLDEAAERIVYKLTGLRNLYLEQVLAFGQPKRDPIERTVSVTYFALINTTVYLQTSELEYEGQWFDIDKLPHLLFDHIDMVNTSIKRLRNKAAFHPVGFELLPEKFTLPQLLNLYEAIFDQVFDRRNFSRKMIASGFISRLNEKQKGVSKKGAFFYKFNKTTQDNTFYLIPGINSLV
ncbi:ADP-ribose pyrophosphatase YjhB, NUDIX family [Spirosomataceae bacterium TFI 002]|nr:ADP-ribose pyrophosphatase YjhB, NUDIX family [Spirosomataceae bacterium TFI 002]